MADLEKLKAFAAEHNFGLTSPLTHAQVVRLAQYWFPEMRFHHDEMFYPIALDQTISMVRDVFANLPASAQEKWRVDKVVRGSDDLPEVRAFDPPIAHVPDGFAENVQVPVRLVRILPPEEAFMDPSVGESAVITHGASFTRSSQFFGPTKTVAGNPEASPGDPFLPRAAADGAAPVITVMASLVNLVELLKYELTVSAAGDDYPPDGLRGGFDIARTLVRQITPDASPLPSGVLRQFFLDAFASQESNGSIPAPTLPPGWGFDRRALNALGRFVFLEYDFFYAYNDFERYQTTLFDNEHEGDDEGCCLVFDRNVLNVAATANDPSALLRAVPHCIITSVHEEFQDADELKFIDPPISFPQDALARDLVPFTVYVAGGSHATYLNGGIHDLVDFQDYTGFIEENPALLLLSAVPGTLLSVLILLTIIEHFTDTEDFTSDDGIRTGPEDVVGEHPLAVEKRLIVMPMSADNHIYGPGNEDLLTLRAFPGKWGGHDSLINKSPAFRPKTGRYFRKLLSSL